MADFDEAADGKDNKITKYKVTSLRTDLVIKQGLGMARKYARKRDVQLFISLTFLLRFPTAKWKLHSMIVKFVSTAKKLSKKPHR